VSGNYWRKKRGKNIIGLEFKVRGGIGAKSEGGGEKGEL